MNRIRQGEILIWTDVARRYGETVALLDGPVGEFAAILFDWEAFPEWAPAQSDARLLERREEASVVHKVIYGESNMPFPFARRKYRCNVVTHEGTDEDGKAIAFLTWDYIPGSGNLKESTGFWYLQSWGDSREQTLARYVAYADPGIWLPDFIINWVTRDVLPKLMKAFGQRHEELYPSPS